MYGGYVDIDQFCKYVSCTALSCLVLAVCLKGAAWVPVGGFKSSSRSLVKLVRDADLLCRYDDLYVINQ